MAPEPIDITDERIKDVIQDLYEIQSSVHGYLGPETQQVLVQKVQDLTSSLTSLSRTPLTDPALRDQVPPEIIAYVSSSRNPDIYTREFVELVQKGNQYLKGKADAFGAFRDALAGEMMMTMLPRDGEKEGERGEEGSEEVAKKEKKQWEGWIGDVLEGRMIGDAGGGAGVGVGVGVGVGGEVKGGMEKEMEMEMSNGVSVDRSA